MEPTTESSQEGSTSPPSPAESVVLPMPNVFVIPPEEEQVDTPPWCCFNADKDAQSDDAFNPELDYSAHADFFVATGASFFDDGAETFYSTVKSRGEMDDGDGDGDGLGMQSISEETESMRERLRALELSTFGNFGPSSTFPFKEPSRSAITDSPKSSRSKKFFSFRSLARGKQEQDLPSPPPVFDIHVGRSSFEIDAEEEDYEVIHHPVLIQSDPRRRKSLFDRAFRLNKRRASENDAMSTKKARSLDVRRSSNEPRHKRSFELPSRESSEQRMPRRFSFFELHRRFSTSSQSTVLTSGQSTSSVDTGTPTASPTTPKGENDLSSVTSMSQTWSKPLPLIVAESPKVDFSSPPSSDREQPAESSADPQTVTPPSSPSRSPPNATTNPTFSLDPLHFESLEFNSEDFF